MSKTKDDELSAAFVIRNDEQLSRNCFTNEGPPICGQTSSGRDVGGASVANLIDDLTGGTSGSTYGHG